MYRCACAAVCVLLEFPSLASAQETTPDLLWFKRYGRGFTGAASVREASDGGFVVAGSTGRGDAKEAYLLRLSSSGGFLWDVVFGTAADARAVDIASDGFVVAGEAHACSGAQCVYLATVDHAGEVLWEKGITTELVVPERNPATTAAAVTTSSDGGFVFIADLRVTGSVDRVYAGKTDASGDLQWERVLCEDDDSRAWCIRGTRDGGYIAAAAGSEGRLVLTRLSRGGGVSWQRTYNEIERVSVQELANGFLVSGQAEEGNVSLRALRTDPSGEVEWQRDFVSDSIAFGESAGVRRLADGEYVGAVVGLPRSGETSVVLLKGDESGALTWETEFGEDFSFVRAFEVTRDGGYVVAGAVTTGGRDLDVFVARLSPTGAGRFIRGDSTGDGRLNVSDVIRSLGHLFGGATEVDCVQSFDVDDDGEVKLTDPLFLLLHLFQAGPPPPRPTLCGIDLTIDALSCQGSRFCRN